MPVRPSAERHQRLGRPLRLTIEADHRDAPPRVAVDLGEVAVEPTAKLIPEHLGEARRPADEAGHARWHALRLDADGERRGARRLRDEQQRVAPGHPAERSELVADEQHQARSDPVAPEVGHRPARRVGLVGEPDLQVLGVARDARAGEAGIGAGRLRDADRLRERTDPRRTEASLDRFEELGDARLRWIAPGGEGDEVHLPAVEAPCHDLGGQPALAQPAHGEIRRGVEQRLLIGRRLSPPEEAGPIRADAEVLGAAVEAEAQPPRPLRTRAQLPVHVAEVRAAHHDQVDASRRELLHRLAQLGGIGGTVRYGRPVPVEDDRFEAPVELGRCRLAAAR